MFRPRVIPVLLLKNQGLVKTTKFKDARYIGDPLNAVKLFNDLKADELVFLDILATQKNRCIDVNFVKKVAEEANMPFAVGGGINSIEQIRQLISVGAEKVVINTFAVKNPFFIKKASSEFGSSTIVISIDYKRNFWGSSKVYINSGKIQTKYAPNEFSKIAEDMGAGEIILNSIEHDGTMGGYDIDMIRKVSESVDIPVVALGGAGCLEDFKKAIDQGCASSVAAGSLFIYHGSRKAVLINYPTREELKNLFNYENNN